MESQASISTDILASYAAGAATDVEGVRGLVESHLHHRHRGVRVSRDDVGVKVELHLRLRWGESIPDVGRGVQQRVCEYLERMAGLAPDGVDVFVDEVDRPA